MIELKAGDIVFYPDTGKWQNRIFTLMQEWGDQMGKMSRETSMTHVGMISTEPDLIIDMKWPRPTFRFIADDTRKKIVMRPKCDDTLKLRAIYWFYFNIGHHYSFWDMLTGVTGINRSFKFCSGMVDRAYKEAGFPLTPTCEWVVSPNELVSSDKLEFIER